MTPGEICAWYGDLPLPKDILNLMSQVTSLKMKLAYNVIELLVFLLSHCHPRHVDHARKNHFPSLRLTFYKDDTMLSSQLTRPTHKSLVAHGVHPERSYGFVAGR
jgi:hypothetical protein